MAETSPRETGDDGPPPTARVHNNQLLSNFNGEERGGDDSEGDDECGKGNGGRGYEDDHDKGHDGTFPEGGGRRWSSSSNEGTQQSNN